MSLPELGDLLARVNAALNFTSFALLVTGLVFIRRRELHKHRSAMTAALVASSIFLVSYLTRVAIQGTHRFAGTGTAKLVYLAILISHIALAASLVFLVPRLVWLLRKRRFSDHARLARWTYPIWLYVSVTGIVVYVLLYQVYGYL